MCSKLCYWTRLTHRRDFNACTALVHISHSQHLPLQTDSLFAWWYWTKHSHFSFQNNRSKFSKTLKESKLNETRKISPVSSHCLLFFIVLFSFAFTINAIWMHVSVCLLLLLVFFRSWWHHIYILISMLLLIPHTRRSI